MAGRISQQEREVLRLLGLGKTSSEIARALGIAESTVAWYVARSVVHQGGERTDLHAFYIARAATRRALAAILILAVVSLVSGAVVLSRSGALDRARILAPLFPTTRDAGPAGGPSVSASPVDRDGASAAPHAGTPTPRVATPVLPGLSLVPLPSVAPASDPLPRLPPPLPTAIPTLGVPPLPSLRLPAPSAPPPVSPPPVPRIP